MLKILALALLGVANAIDKLAIIYQPILQISQFFYALSKWTYHEDYRHLYSCIIHALLWLPALFRRENQQSL